jgi:putative peptidoglycan lipid II flippase
MAFFKSMATVSGLTLLSRVFGYLRDVLIASTFGNSGVSDAFFIALRLPNVFRRLFAEGAMNSAFVPIFSHLHKKEGRDKALRFSCIVFSTLATILFGLVAFVEVLMPWVMSLIAPGFKSDPEKFQQAVDFGHLIFPYIFFISLAALCSSILNALNRFFAASASPIILNICAILAVAVYVHDVNQAGYALSFSIAIAGLIQFVWVFMACRRANVRLRFTKVEFTPEVKKLLRKMLPGIAGAGVYQINLLISDIIASFFPMAVSYISYADRVNQFPLSIIGIALGTVLLPVFSRQVQKERHDQAMYMQNRALQFSFMLTFPATVALYTISLPIIITLFQHNNFTHEMSLNVAKVMGIFAMALPANVMIKIFSANFFSRGDTLTPVKAAITSLITNVVLNLILSQYFSYFGIAAGNVIASWVNGLLLAYWLRQEDKLIVDTRLKQTLPRLLLSSIGMGWVLYQGMEILLPYFGGALSKTIISLFVLISSGLISYFILIKITKSFTYSEFKEAMNKASEDSQAEVV